MNHLIVYTLVDGALTINTPIPYTLKCGTVV